jgi:hypothetical protein
MNQNENEETPRPIDYAKAICLVSVTVYSTYQLGRLGYDWVREINQSRKDKKNQK